MCTEGDAMTAHSEYAASSSMSCLNRLLEEAPYLSRCSDNKTAMLNRPRNYAVRWPYMQVNRHCTSTNKARLHLCRV